jgi:hypothetical protein
LTLPSRAAERISVISYLLVATSGLPACLLNQDHCKDAKPTPVEGSQSSYTLKPGSYQGVTLDSPVVCTDSFYIDGTFIALHGQGTRKFGFGVDSGCAHRPGSGSDGGGGGGCSVVDWGTFTQQVSLALPSIDNFGGGLGNVCGISQPAGCMFFFSLRDWSQVNTVATTLLSKIAEWELGICVGVFVSGQAATCAH